MTNIKVLSTHAVEEVLRELGPAFEHASGASLTIHYDPANVLKRKIEDGATFDVTIVTRQVIDAPAGQGKVSLDSCVDIGRALVSESQLRKGAAKPDLTTVEAFKCALLAAKSVVRSREGTSGFVL